jgi:hypothetical protein
MSESTDLTQRKADLAAQDFGEHAGGGMENVNSNDIAIPFLGIIQQLSPQILDGEEKFIPDAKVGMLYNTVTNELIGDGSQAIFVPCCKESKYVEWIPRDQGGGLVGMHEPGSAFVNACKAAAKDQFKLKTDEDHDLIETHYVYGMLLNEANGTNVETPIVIGFSSSKIKVYKQQLMTRIRTVKGNPPMYAFRFAITTILAKNKANQPYHNFKIDPVNGAMVDSANLPGSEFEVLLTEGKSLVEAVHGGTAKADHDSNDAGQGGQGGAGGGEDEAF